MLQTMFMSDVARQESKQQTYSFLCIGANSYTIQILRNQENIVLILQSMEETCMNIQRRKQ